MNAFSLPKLLLHVGFLSLFSLNGYTPIAQANYRPKPGQVGPATGPTVPTGTRGSCEGGATPQRLTAIAPLSHIGKTANPTPTVTWFVPESTPRPLTLRVWDGNKILWQTTLQTQPGLMSHPLPKLQPDRPYRWQLVLACNPSRPSQNQVTDAFILYTPLSLSRPATREAQVVQLSEAALWYDALTIAQPDVKLYQSLITDLMTIETEAIEAQTQDNKNNNAKTELLKQHLRNLKSLRSP